MPDFQIPGADGAEPTTVTVPDGYHVVGGELPVPDGFVPADRFGAELDRRVTSTIQKRGLMTADEAYADEAFAKQLKARGIELDEAGKPVTQLDKAKLDELRGSWEQEALTPLQEQLDTANKTLATVRAEAFGSELSRELAKTLSDDAIAPRAKGFDSDLEQIRKRFVRADDEGRFYFAATEGAMPNYDVAAAITAWAQTNAPHLLRDQRQGGPGGGNSGGGGGQQTITRAQFDAMDPAGKAEFVSKGGRVTD